MPHPAYLICSRSGAIDLLTNWITCSDLVEMVPIVRDGREWRVQVKNKDTSEPLSLRIVAAWYKGEADSPRHSYEGEILLRFPGRREPFAVPVEPFTFQKHFHRYTVPCVEITTCPQPGVLVVEARIRPVGGGDWLGQQTYPIILEEGRVEV